jgi:hypothetical protein
MLPMEERNAVAARHSGLMRGCPLPKGVAVFEHGAPLPGACRQTNRRLMAQYGFVPGAGNPWDRLEFAALQQQQLPPGSAAALGPGVQLSLDAAQRCLGDGQAMAAALGGRDPHMYAALKSLPLAASEADAAPPAAQRALVRALRAELDAERAGWPTTASQDAALLAGQGQGVADGRLPALWVYRFQRKVLVAAGASLLERLEGELAAAL